ncbi:MAG: hypothetical protein AMK69_13160 [Nitrospira bacterium SG8_3]|nr:MAG: hypothetical protein AMK69_13160 [Nitrospira bacterium SG8_3]
MKIGVISDTHLKTPESRLEEVVKEVFKDVQLILHGGDLHSLEMLDAFQGKEVIAVAGNCDSSEVRQRFSTKEVIPINHYKIGLIHGWGWPVGIEKRLTAQFDDIHCLVYGHTHWAVNHLRNGILYFNPGSFSSSLFSFWRRSVGLLTINEGIHGEIIPL